MQAISPRTLVIDLNAVACLNKKSEPKSVITNISPRGRVKIAIPIPSSGRETTSKCVDSSRRHASCGPRLMSVVGATNDDPIIDENNPKMEMKCIGSKCGTDKDMGNIDLNNNQIIVSPHKTSLDTPRSSVSHLRHRLRPLNALSKTNAAVSANGRTLLRTATVAPTNYRDYRKYLTQNQHNLPTRVSMNEHYYNSHFYAVGLSVRAWRSKYNRMYNANDDCNKIIATKSLNITK